MNRANVLAFFGSLMIAAAAFGQNWNNAAGGSWQTPSNWSGDALPTAPVFDLDSLTGYTVSLSANVPVGQLTDFTVQSDQTMLSLGGYTITSPEISVGQQTGQNGSLTLLGPGTFYNADAGITGRGTGSVDVGDNGGTGSLTINDAVLQQEGPGLSSTQGFKVSNLTVENGGSVQLDSEGSFTIGAATINDGTIQVTSGKTFSLSDATVENGSSIGLSGFGGATNGVVNVSNSTIENVNSYFSADGPMNVGPNVTITNQASIGGAETLTVIGTDTVSAGGNLSAIAVGITMQSSSVLVLQLNGSYTTVSYPSAVDKGTLDITLQNGFEPVMGEQFDVLNGLAPFPEGVSPSPGTFASVELPALPAGEYWTTNDLYTTGVIGIVPEPASVGLMGIAAFGLMLRRRAASSRGN